MKLTLDVIERFRKRKAGYQTIFRGPYGADVLADLAMFCCAFDSTIGPRDRSDRDMIVAEGRRQVYLRIMKHLNFTPEELAVHYDAVLRIPQE